MQRRKTIMPGLVRKLSVDQRGSRLSTTMLNVTPDLWTPAERSYVLSHLENLRYPKEANVTRRDRASLEKIKQKIFVQDGRSSTRATSASTFTSC